MGEPQNMILYVLTATQANFKRLTENSHSLKFGKQSAF